MMNSLLSQGLIKQQAREVSTQCPQRGVCRKLTQSQSLHCDGLRGSRDSSQALFFARDPDVASEGQWNGGWGLGHFSRLLLYSVPAPLTLTSGPFSIAAGTLGARGTNLHTVAWPVRQMRVWARKRIAALSAALAPRPPPTHAMGSSVTAATVSSSATMR